MMVARPYVIVNVAATVDGKIDTFERRGAAISSERDRQRVDELRASVDAVMVGDHTVVQEDPRLTVKSPELRAERLARGLAENPAKIAIASAYGRVNPRGRFVTDGPARVIVFTPADAANPTEATLHEGQAVAADSAQPPLREERIETSESTLAPLRQKGVEIFALGEGRVDLGAAMTTLFDEGIRRVLVEGGGSLNFELLRLGLVDEVQVFIAPLLFGGASAPTLADGAGLLREAAIALSRTEVEVWEDGGVLLRYMVEPRE